VISKNNMRFGAGGPQKFTRGLVKYSEITIVRCKYPMQDISKRMMAKYENSYPNEGGFLLMDKNFKILMGGRNGAKRYHLRFENKIFSITVN